MLVTIFHLFLHVKYHYLPYNYSLIPSLHSSIEYLSFMWYIRYFDVDKHSLTSSNALRIFSDFTVY